MPLPALVLLGLLFVVHGSASGESAQLTQTRAGSSDDSVSLVQLRQQAKEARWELQQATRRYERGMKRLESARRRLERMQQELRRTRAKLESMQVPLDEIANAAYQKSPVSGFRNLLLSRNPQAAMRTAVDFSKLTRQKEAMLREVSRLVRRKQRLVRSAESLAKQAEAKTERLERQRRKLRKTSQRQTRQLVTKLQSIGLDVSPGERLPLDCDPTAASAGAYPNGLIPKSALCPLPQEGEYLLADAAVAFSKLNLAYARHFGEPICVTDSYRSLSIQQSLYARKPALAAVPGTSKHGLGVAVDLCGGVQAFGTEEFRWMKQHAPEYGWVHPDWAAQGGSRPEPWHWEYEKATP